MKFSLSTIGRREMIVIYLALLVVCGILMYYIVVAPEIKRYRKARSEYYSQQQKEMRTIIQRDNLVGEYVKLREEADQVQKLLFTKREAEDFLEMLPVLSSQTKNDLTSITPKGSTPLAQQDPKTKSEPTPLDEIAQIPVNVTITGKYEDIISLFKTLEGYEQLMAISDINMNANSEDPNEIASSFSLNLIHVKSAIKPPSRDLLDEIVSRSQSGTTAEVEVASREIQIIEEPETTPPVKAAVPVKRPPVRTEKPPLAGGKAGAGGQRDDPNADYEADEDLEVIQRYTVQVGAFEVEKNSQQLARMLRSMNYEPWVRPSLLTGAKPYHLLVGKFRTKEEADKFGMMLKQEVPWVKEYIIKRIYMKRDVVPEGLRVES